MFRRVRGAYCLHCERLMTNCLSRGMTKHLEYRGAKKCGNYVVLYGRQVWALVHVIGLQDVL